MLISWPSSYIIWILTIRRGMKLTTAGFIKKQAEENWKERAVLMQHMQDLCEDDEICEAINKVEEYFKIDNQRMGDNIYLSQFQYKI